MYEKCCIHKDHHHHYYTSTHNKIKNYIGKFWFGRFLISVWVKHCFLLLAFVKCQITHLFQH